MSLKIKRFFKSLGRKISNLAFKIYRKTFMASGTRNVVVMVIVFTIGFGFYSYFYWDDTFEQFIGTVAGLATSVFVGSLIHLISLGFEDRNKVSHDYNKMSLIYNTDELLKEITFKDNTKINFLYKGSAGIINKLEVIDSGTKMFQPTDVMSSYFVKLFGAHRGSFKKNGFTVRVDELEEKNNVLLMKTSRSTYFNHLISNRVMDYPFAKSLTLRKLYEPGPDITPIKNSVFSNHLGIIGIIETKDHYFVINKRSKTGSTSKDLLVSPVAFGLSAGIRDKVDEKYILDKITLEANKRLRKNKEDKSDYVSEIINIGYGRDIYEGGKPHLFYLIKTNLAKDEYLKLFEESECVKATIDYDSKAFLIKAEELSYQNNFFHIKHYPIKGKSKIHLLNAETNLIMNIKCLQELNLFN